MRQQLNAFVFASPAVAGDFVYLGVVNGTVEARDLTTGNLLWDFRTEASKRNANWLLTAEGKFNTPLLYYTGWREAGQGGADRQFSAGSLLSSPILVNGVVYVGSSDGYVYAIE